MEPRRATTRPCTTLPVLLIDDDHAFRSALAGTLRHDGHEILDHPPAKRKRSLESFRKVGAVIMDLYMAREDGLSFADAFHAAHPETPIVLVTAHWSYHLAREAAKRSYLHVRRKPLDYNEFHTLLHSLAR